jgi:threonine dehydrogenase-like Zn-dependent dehydrogenase
MRALVLEGTGTANLSVRTVPTPRPGPRQLLARVDAAGICTSLIKLVEQGPNHKQIYGWDIRRWPLILGDEGAVTLVEVGEEMKGRFRAGERYVIQPAVDHPPINHRERYRNAGRGIKKVAVGYTLPGHLAEFMLVPEEVIEAECLVSFPRQDLPLAHAAMSEPFSCVISAQDHHVHLVQGGPRAPRSAVKGIKPNGITVIIGAGAMGRMHVDLALSCRPKTVVVSDLVPSRLDLVRNLFAERAERAGIGLQTVHASTDGLGPLVDGLTEGAGADDIIVAVGSPRAIEDAQNLAGRGAVLNLFGGLKKGEDLIGLDTGIVHYQEINVTGSSGGSPWDIARTLELMAAGQIDAAAHITRIGDLEHAPEFLRMIREQEIDGKAVVYPHRRTKQIVAVKQWTAAQEKEYLSRN